MYIVLYRENTTKIPKKTNLCELRTKQPLAKLRVCFVRADASLDSTSEVSKTTNGSEYDFA